MILIKLGGSLFRYIREISIELKRHKNILIIPGGGPFSRFVRNLYEKRILDEETSHILAILAMEQYGYYINKHLNFNKIYDLRNIKLPGIIFPYEILKGDDFLEKSWRVTSDSIACYIAYKLNIDRVIKLTDVHGIYNKGKIIDRISAKDLLSMKFKPVDDMLPHLIIRFKIYFQIINGRDLEIIRRAILGENVGTIIYP